MTASSTTSDAAAYTAGMNTTSPTPSRPAAKKLALWPHQEDAVRDVLAELEAADRAQLISACGTGKTIATHAICEKSGAGLVLVFLPSISLIDQNLDPWAAQYEGRMRAVVVCSDKTVGKGSRKRSRSQGDSEDIVSDEQLRSHGASVVRDVAELAGIVTHHDVSAGPLVVFSTYQSSEKVAQMQEVTGITFDIAIADEAHRLAVGSRARASARAGKLVLDNDAILVRKRVFATATPKLYKTNANEPYQRTDEASMDNEVIFGRVAHRLSLREAIRRHLLTEYRIHIMVITTDELTVGIDADDDSVRLDLGVIARIRADEDLGAKRVIAYLSRRDRAREFVRRAKAAGISNVDFITGDLTAEQREPKLTMLKSGGTLANVRCLSEGVDIPSLDAVIFVDPRQSKIDIVQAVGRAIRTSPGKKLGHVILPVLIDPGTPSEGWLEGNGFRGVWEVLAQMAANDTTLSTYLRALLEERDIAIDEHPDGGTSSDASDIDNSEFPHGMDTALAGASIITTHFPTGAGIDGRRLAELLQQKIVLRAAELNDPIGAEFRKRAFAVRDLLASEARWPNSKSPDDAEAQLGRWVTGLRTKRSSPSVNQVAFLNETIPGWSEARRKQGPARTFEESADALGAFKCEHLRWPAQRGAEISLGRFYTNQRRAKRLGLSWWSEARESYLNRVAPGWDD